MTQPARDETLTLGQMLARLRRGAGMTPEELARKAGVPLVSYRNWEYDHRVPGLVMAGKLARALGVPLQVLAECAEADEHRGQEGLAGKGDGGRRERRPSKDRKR